MSSEYPRVGCVVVSYNGCDDTCQCLESLRAQTYGNIDVYVVDNASTDNSRQILPERFPWAHYIWNERNLNWVIGANQGLTAVLESGAEFSLILNNDVVLDRELIAVLVERMYADEQVGVVSPKIYYANDPEKLCYAGCNLYLVLGLSWNIGNRQNDAACYSTYRETDSACGACMLVRNEVLQQVGLLSRDFVPLCWDDAELSTRIKKAGYKVTYEPRAAVYHKVSASLGQFSPWKLELKAEKALVFIRKHGTTWQKLLALLGYPMGLIGTTMIYFLLTRNLKIWPAVFKGVFKGLTHKMKDN